MVQRQETSRRLRGERHPVLRGFEETDILPTAECCRR